MSQPQSPLILVDTDPKSHTYQKKYSFDLSKFESSAIRFLYKKYLIEKYKSGVKVNTLRSKYTSMPPVVEYLNLNHIYLLNSITTETVNDLVSFLATVPSKKTGKKYKYKSQYDAIGAFKSFIEWVQITHPNMGPSVDVFVECEFKKVNRSHDISYFSDNIIKQIDAAVHDEKNPYVKAFVSISRHTGLRMSDILALSYDCVGEGLLSGYVLNYYNHKERRKGKSIPIPASCYQVVVNLAEHTEKLRKEASSDIKEFLFIHRIQVHIPNAKFGEIRVLTNRGIQAWVDAFSEYHQIVDANGHIVRIRAHMMRRSLGTNLIADNVSPLAVKDILDHDCLRTSSMYYIGQKNATRAEVTHKLGVIGSIDDIPDSTFDSDDEKSWFYNHAQSEAYLSDGYCTKALLPNGEICPHLLARNKCYFCVKYITTPEFLDVHKAHLAQLERIVEDGKALYGNHYEEHFTKTIAVLNEIIEKLTQL